MLNTDIIWIKLYQTLCCLLNAMFPRQNLVDDTQRIMGCKGVKLIEEAYIFGAYTLYLNIISLLYFIVVIGSAAVGPASLNLYDVMI